MSNKIKKFIIIEKEITKAAQILTTTSAQDKEKVLLPLLNKIGNIQNANNTFTKRLIIIF